MDWNYKYALNFSFDTGLIEIFYKDLEIEAIKRYERYTFSDFMAICGGSLGLFMGISMLSIVELIYFCTLRWFCRIRRSAIVRDSVSNRSKWMNFIVVKIIRPTHPFVTEICNKSSVHGVRYFTQKSIHWSERLVHPKFYVTKSQHSSCFYS